MMLAVLTCETVETILQVGGTQSWALDRARASKCNFVILCRNGHSREARATEPHGTAFMVGKIEDIVPSTERNRRWLVLISEYARLDVPDQWYGRNPISYREDNEFPEIDFSALEFEEVRKPATGLTLAQAKAGLAVGLSVPESAIEIIVRA